MSVGAIVAVAVGVLTLLAALGRGLWAIHKGVNLVQDTREEVATVRDEVAKMHAALNNGIRADMRTTAAAASEARVLAADAARAASVASQRVMEGQQEVSRAVNALRSEVDIYTNVVLSDRHRIRAALRDLGHDIADDDESPEGDL